MNQRGKRTKAEIIEQAAHVFNQKGYEGSSIQDLMVATGLKKGGIYNHFESKQNLALLAFEHAIDKVDRAIAKALAPCRDEGERLLTLIHFYREYPQDPEVKGGCPLLNTIIDSDDGNAELKRRAKAAYEHWIKQLTNLIQRGQQRGIFNPAVEAKSFAIVILAVIEGGIALSRFGDPHSVMNPVMDHLTHTVRKTLNF